ncbi:MAG: hypothetical protein K0Q72_2119 [Armatimonadetes bacterium]|nr:hypothetical protein [Armatimonadota bacterium]
MNGSTIIRGVVVLLLPGLSLLALPVGRISGPSGRALQSASGFQRAASAGPQRECATESPLRVTGQRIAPGAGQHHEE